MSKISGLRRQLRKRYRIVRDGYLGYEVQVWRWYWPFWVQPYTNTHSSIERAEIMIEFLKNKVVKYVD